MDGYSNPGRNLHNPVECLQERAYAKAKCDVGHPFQESGSVQGGGKRPSSPEQNAFHFQAKAFQFGCFGLIYLL